jgi:hypothetical protein
VITVVASLAVAAESACTFARDGVEVDHFVCGEGGAWTARCPAPPQGVIRATLSMPDRKLVGEARVSLGTSGTLVLPLSGPGGRPSGFLVNAPGANLLPGQAIGPQQLCPVVQPGAVPGAPPAELPLEVVVAVHRIVGYDDVVLDGGVLGRAPRYDDGSVHARGRVNVVQHEVPIIPVLVGRDAIPLPEDVHGTVSVRRGEEWASVGYSGYTRLDAVGVGELSLLVVDFGAPEVERAFGADAVDAVTADLTQALASQLTPLSTVWSRGPVDEPITLPAWSAPAGTFGWRTAETGRVHVRVGRSGHRMRVVLAEATIPLDGEVRRAIDEAAAP